MLIDLWMLKNPCIPGIIHLVMIYDLFNMLFDSLCWNGVKDFLHLCSSVILACNFLFCVSSLSGFGIRVMVATQNEFGSLPSSSVFWKSLSKIGVSSSLNFWQNSAVKPSDPELLFVGRFYYSFDLCACDGSVKIFCFFLDFFF